MDFFFFLNQCVNTKCCLDPNGYRAIYWSMGGLSGATTLIKLARPVPTAISCHSFSAGGGTSGPWFTSYWDFVWLNLVNFNPSRHELMCARGTLLCPENSFMAVIHDL